MVMQIQLRSNISSNKGYIRFYDQNCPHTTVLTYKDEYHSGNPDIYKQNFEARKQRLIERSLKDEHNV